MASEIRVNKINNRAGLGTVEYTPTGIIVSGIVTAYEFDGNFDTTPGIVITGIGTAQSLDVDDFVDVGNIIKLGNAGVVTATTFSTANVDVTTDKIVVGTGVTIEANQVANGQATFTGIVTASSFSGDGSSLTGIDATALKDAGGVVKIQALSTGAVFTGIHTFSVGVEVGSNIKLGNAGVITATSFTGSGANLTSIPAGNLTGTVADARISTLTASKLSGALPAISGANLTNLPPSAPVGGASTNTVFFENAKEVAVNYQITSNKNAMSAGPIAINAGIAVTVPSGSAWTIV